MSKEGTSTPTKKPTTTGATAPTGAPAAHGGGNSPTQFLNPKGKAAREVLPGMCSALSCKSKASRFAFCEEHYDHFKFGLIKKNGEPVSDYEKKIEHYLAMKSREKGAARKVA